MKTTALTDLHLSLNAKMVPFAGFSMPVQYDGIQREHRAVRNHVGIFDVSHMGEFFIRGKQALALIQFIISNDASTLKIGQAQYAYMPNTSGGIVDDLIVYKIAEDEYMLVVNASNIAKDWNWIKTNNINFGAELYNASEEWSLLAVQGPKAHQVLQNLTEINLKEIPFYHFIIGSLGGIKNIIISATGYTGSGGFELYIPNTHAKLIWKMVTSAGAQPVGLAARDTLRLEMGYCLYGNDIDDKTSPIAAGLGWCTKFTKNFVNHHTIQRQKKEGTPQKRIGFVLEKRGIPRNGYSLFNEQGKAIGKVTSGTSSPTLGKGIGMGYINTEYAIPNQKIYVEIRNKKISSLIQKFPFYKT